MNDGSPKDALPLHGMQILVVDDDLDTLEMEKILLENAGALVECTDTVDGALRAVQERRPDLVLSDVAMPGKDGWTLAVALREALAKGEPPVTLVALSGHASDMHVRESLARGFDLYLVKPIHPGHLIDSLARFARQGGPGLP